jgi:hypothetical protein
LGMVRVISLCAARALLLLRRRTGGRGRTSSAENRPWYGGLDAARDRNLNACAGAELHNTTAAHSSSRPVRILWCPPLSPEAFLSSVWYTHAAGGNPTPQHPLNPPPREFSDLASPTPSYSGGGHSRSELPKPLAALWAILCDRPLCLVRVRVRGLVPLNL